MDSNERVEPRLLDLARRMAETTPGAFRFIRGGRGKRLRDVSEITGLTGVVIDQIELGHRQVPNTLGGLRYAQWLLDPRNEP